MENLRIAGFSGTTESLHEDCARLSNAMRKTIREQGAVSGESLDLALLNILGRQRNRWERELVHKRYSYLEAFVKFKYQNLSRLIKAALELDNLDLIEGKEVSVVSESNLPIYKIRSLMPVYFCDRSEALNYVSRRIKILKTRTLGGKRVVEVSFSEQ